MRAFDTAARAHGAQTRKHSGLPYIIHPARVAERLRAIGVQDAVILTAAYLHDTLEDTQYSLLRMTGEFGSSVAKIVSELTKEKGAPVDVSVIKDPRAILIKMMDRIDNMQDFKNDRGSVPKGYTGKAREILARARALGKSASGPLGRQIAAACLLLGREIRNSR